MRKPKQVVYSIRDLADLAGTSKGQMERLLKANDVDMKRTGQKKGKRVITLSDIERAFPELTDSIRFKSGDDD